MRPSRHTPSSLSQRVQRHSGFRVLGLGFALVDQLDGAAWREGKGVGIGELLYAMEPPYWPDESEMVRPLDGDQMEMGS